MTLKEPISKINDNTFLCTFIDSYVTKFRKNNSDDFNIVISGIKSFVSLEDKNLTYLFRQLEENKITLEFECDKESIDYIDVVYINLSQGTSYKSIYHIQNIPLLVELSSKTEIPSIGIIIMNIVSHLICKLKTIYKAIVLDLDDTLWRGTLLEIGTDKIIENMSSKSGFPFIEFMNFVKNLTNELGIFIALCSRNDLKTVESTIERMDEKIFPLKNHVDYIITNNNDKSENIRTIAEELSILPNSIVFIDDNQIVRDEVKNRLPEVFVPEWENHYELITLLNAACIFDRFELSLNSQNRRKQYKILQQERAHNSLPPLSVKINSDNGHTESIKLYSKSNQFKFSQHDINFNAATQSVYFEIYRENGEDLGICSTMTYTFSSDSLIVQNWAISCRFFQIGLEEFILMFINHIAKAKKIFINYQHSEHNKKVRDLMAKYSDAFIYNDQKDLMEIRFTKEIDTSITKNTKLRNIENE